MSGIELNLDTVLPTVVSFFLLKLSNGADTAITSVAIDGGEMQQYDSWIEQFNSGTQPSDIDAQMRDASKEAILAILNMAKYSPIEGFTLIFDKTATDIPDHVSNVEVTVAEAILEGYVSALAGFDTTHRWLLCTIPVIKGDKGDKGDTGLAGADGADGAKGDTGETGAPGTPGTPGTPGAPGTPGTPGRPGPGGAPGNPGGSGPGGAPASGDSLVVLAECAELIDIPAGSLGVYYTDYDLKPLIIEAAIASGHFNASTETLISTQLSFDGYGWNGYQLGVVGVITFSKMPKSLTLTDGKSIKSFVYATTNNLSLAGVTSANLIYLDTINAYCQPGGVLLNGSVAQDNPHLPDAIYAVEKNPARLSVKMCQFVKKVGGNLPFHWSQGTNTADFNQDNLIPLGTLVRLGIYGSGGGGEGNHVWATLNGSTIEISIPRLGAAQSNAINITVVAGVAYTLEWHNVGGGCLVTIDLTDV
ncbi:MAG: hypothetical protein HXX20_13065 [Chloroflexi bacterium]|nr:hypothetical protein [Chloroflexota bacterium]NWJ96708.1 hypothetical protein [Chloroflexota bacterium]